MAYGGNPSSGQPGLPSDYGSGGVMSSGPGTVHGHLKQRPDPVTGPGATRGLGPHRSQPPHMLGGTMTPEQVRAMQQFLNNHGFQVAQDGILGPLTKSAAAAFRANHKGGEAWSAQHGIGVHPSGRAPVPRAGSGVGDSPTGAGAPAVDPTASAFTTLLTSLLKGGGVVGDGYLPKSFGDAAAAPDVALAKSYADQIGLNPKQEKQNQYDISSWYGLDPNDPNYAISVLGRLGTAADRNATAATDTAGNVSDIAKSLAGSIGGSANGASGSVLAAGADAAGLASALGQADKSYANDMNPLLAAEARGQMSREKAANAQSLMGLREKLAQASGQAESDRAQGVMAAQDKNNSLGQQRFANEGNLLSMLSQLMAVDPNAAGLKDAKTVAEINKIIAQTNAVNNPSSKAPTHVDLAQAGSSIAGLLGVGSDHILPQGVSVTKLAYTIGSQLQALGFQKGTPAYQRFGQILISMFKDGSGNPITAPRSWFGPGS